VVLCGEAGAVCGVDVRGGAPGTRETALLDPVCTVQRVHAVLLAGGSAYGLDAAGGVARWLEARGIGVRIGPVLPEGGTAVVPIVPAAILFDLWVGDASLRPDAAAGFAACAAASVDAPIAEGSVGAGAGATVGKLFGIERATRGGLGVETLAVNGITVAAMAVVNALGDVVDPVTGAIVAGARGAEGGWLDQSARLRAGDWPLPRGPVIGPAAGADTGPLDVAGAATTLAIVATDAVLDKAEATKVAQMAHDGLARVIRPLHTPGDGDTVFALATGASGERVPTAIVGALAADALEGAVLRAVRAASTWNGADGQRVPACRDLPLVERRHSP
jgi:L-aminopeptidase/D-esterase-like protein